MLEFLKRVNLLLVLVVLFCFHGFMYSSLGNPNWFGLTVVATVVDTGILIGLKYLVIGTWKQRGK